MNVVDGRKTVNPWKLDVSVRRRVNNNPRNVMNKYTRVKENNESPGYDFLRTEASYQCFVCFPLRCLQSRKEKVLISDNLETIHISFTSVYYNPKLWE